MSDQIRQEVAISGEGNIVVGRGDVIINPLPPAEARMRHDLGILLKNVETTWIKGVLDKSTHEAALLELGMETRAEAIDNPWRMIMERPGKPRETIPRGKKIKDIFYEANGMLLILGEPGSGKTTTLLQLARDLIVAVDRDFTQPIPVILNLSTWTNKQQPLEDWLVSELNSKYRLPKKDGQEWLKARRILPLLDGLDEVKAENRTACVEKINQLVDNYGLQGIVVCSRIKDYSDLTVRLAFYAAVYLQPLTPEQIDEYLGNAGNRLAGLRSTLQNDEALRSMAQTPLMLNLMSLAYQDASTADLNNLSLESEEARRNQLFNVYIDRMFSRKPGTQTSQDDLTKQHLSWLARNMQRQNQEVFLIEGLQPSWLPTVVWRSIYFFVSRLVIGLIWGFIFGLDFQWVQGRINVSVRILLLVLYGVLAVGFVDALRFELRDKWPGRKSVPLIYWLIIYIVVALSVGWPRFWFVGGAALHYALNIGLLFGLRANRPNRENDIQTPNYLRWSWVNAALGGLLGVFIGFVFRFTDRILTVLFDPISSLSNSISVIHQLLLEPSWIIGQWYVAVYYGLLGVIIMGMRREITETKSDSNQGIQLWVRNALVGGLIIMMISMFDHWLINLSPSRTFSYSDLRFVLSDALPFAILGALWYGGFDIIQHCTLRLILVLQGRTPFNYARFLDYAVARIFLQKVGGGYRFIHRLLLEHFAGLGPTKNYD